MFGGNNQQPNLFGGNKTFGSTFGSNQTNNTGFGSTNTFGQQQQGFGTGGGFGQQQQQQPAAGGFGSTTFGQNQAGFGSTNTFGQPQASGFGQQPSAFGGGVNGNQPTTPQQNNGTGNPTWQFTVEREGATAIQTTVHFQSISAMPAYRNWSAEELRLADYQANKKFASGGSFGSTATTNTGGFGSTTSTFGQPATTSTFGQPATTSTFGQPASSPFGKTTGFGATTTNTFGQQPTTSAFGQTNTTSAFGQPQSTTTSAFGQPAANTGFGTGGFGATNTNTSGFGQTTSTFGQQPTTSAFGQPQSTTTSAFGQPAANTGFGTGGFGATNTTGGFGQTTSAFGQQPAATTTFGQPSTSTFGQPATTSGFGQTTTTTGFGQQQQPATNAFGTGGGLFGKPAATTTSAFGQPQATNTTTNLFGQTNATAPNAFGTGTTGFGQQPAATTSAFGQQPAGTVNAFGQQPAATTGTTGFGFGQTQPAATTAPSTGLFGTTTTTQPAGGLFSNTGGFGQKPATTTAFGAQPTTGTTSLFGKPATTATTGGLFGQQPAQQPVTTGGLFGQTPQNTTTAFGASTNTNNLFAKPAVGGFGTSIGVGQQPVLHASLDKNPYGVNPVLTKSTNEPAPIQQPTPQKKLPTVVPSFKVTPRSSSQIKLRGVAPPSPTPALAESYRNQIKILDGSPRDVVALGLDTRFTPRRSVKRLTIDDASALLQTPKEKTVQFDVPEATPVTTTTRSLTGTPSSNSEYEMSPDLDTLLRMSDDELKHVEKFKISLPRYGSVEFVEPVNLFEIGRSNLQNLAGNEVVIEFQSVSVYPDDDTKPPVGTALNKPAIVTLLGCWAKDKSTGAIVDQLSDPRYERHLSKLKRMEGTTFISFETATGTWKFRVEHFSRYGLVDSDDEGDAKQEETPDDEDDPALEDTFMKGGKWELVPKPGSESEEVSGTEESSDESGDVQTDESLETDETEDSENEGEENTSSSEMEQDEESVVSSEIAEVPEQVQLQSPERPQILGIGASLSPMEYMKTARSVQSMKATLFGPSPSKPATQPVHTPSFDMKEQEKRVGEIIPDFKNARPVFSAFAVEGGDHVSKYQKQTPEGPKVVPVDLSKLVDWSESLTNKTRLYVDAAHFQGRTFKPCFTNDGIFVKNQ